MRTLTLVAALLATLIAATAAFAQDGAVTQPEGGGGHGNQTVEVDYGRINQMIKDAIAQLNGAIDPAAIEAIVQKYTAQCATTEELKGLQSAIEASVRTEIAKGQQANAAKLDAMNGRISALEGRVAAIERQLAATAKTVEETKALAQTAADQSTTAAAQATEANAHAKAADEALSGTAENPGGLKKTADDINGKVNSIKTTTEGTSKGVTDANTKLEDAKTILTAIQGALHGTWVAPTLFGIIILLALAFLWLMVRDNNRKLKAVMDHWGIVMPVRPAARPAAEEHRDEGDHPDEPVV